MNEDNLEEPEISEETADGEVALQEDSVNNETEEPTQEIHETQVETAEEAPGEEEVSADCCEDGDGEPND